MRKLNEKNDPVNNPAKYTGMIPAQGGELREHERIAFGLLEQAKEAIDDLAKERIKLKMSNSRIVGISKEINELIKVLTISVY